MAARVSPNRRFFHDNNMDVLGVLRAYEILRANGLILLILEVDNTEELKENNWSSIDEDIDKKGRLARQVHPDDMGSKGNDLKGNVSKQLSFIKSLRDNKQKRVAGGKVGGSKTTLSNKYHRVFYGGS